MLRFEAGDQPQDRAFAAAAGAEEHTNSPLPGKSATTKFTSRMAVNWFDFPSLYVLVTFLNSTTCGTFNPGGFRTLPKYAAPCRFQRHEPEKL